MIKIINNNNNNFQAMTQERRRYGFVLERQCSLAKHYLAYHNAGVSSYGRNLDEWQDVARTREYLPESVENMFALKLRVSVSFYITIDVEEEEKLLIINFFVMFQQLSIWQDDDNFSSETILDDDRISISSQLRKTKSMDASCLDIRSINDVSSLKPLSRAKSEFNINSSNNSLVQGNNRHLIISPIIIIIKLARRASAIFFPSPPPI